MLAVVLLLAAGCGKEKNEVSVPKGMVQVNFCQQGTFGAPFSDLTAEKGFVNLTRGSVPVGYEPKPIEDGTTLWVVVYRAAQEQQTNGETVQTQSPLTGERATTEPPSDASNKSQFLREHVQFVRPMEVNSTVKGIKM